MLRKKEENLLARLIRKDGAEQIRPLIEGGISPDQELAIGDRHIPVSLLAYAAECGALRTMRYLLKAGADPDYGKNYTPLVTAIHSGNMAALKLLLKAGANPNRTIQFRAPGMEQFDKGWTALMSAAMCNNLKIVDLLLEHGADPNAKTRAGFSAVHFAAQFKNQAVIQRLGGSGGRLGGEALIKAIPDCDVEMVRKCIHAGADVNAVGGRIHESMIGQTPLEGAVRERATLIRCSESLLKLARARGEEAQVSQQIALKKTQYLEIINELIAVGAKLNERHFWKSSLYMASEVGDLELVAILLKSGANPNVADCFNGKFYQDSALHVAAKGGFAGVVEVLLAAGANRGKKNGSGKTPAALARKGSLVAKLLEK